MTPLNSEAAILKRVIEAEVDDLPPETAHYILRLRFTEPDLQRMDELAAKARAGTLKEAERAEVENYEHVGHLLALMQSKARRSLSKVGSPS
jgi:hypothetical protein